MAAWLGAVAAIASLTSVVAWQADTTAAAARAASPLVRRPVTVPAPSALGDLSAVIGVFAAITGCLIVTVISIRLLVRLHARRVVRKA
ncbi:hypothetical protein [Halorubrum sp. DTA46]|uniref:hypothetical protein n=1 Tax=Halorubrum sp. DTA46 TaxID=3402162 RepID=UPI003AAA6611